MNGQVVAAYVAGARHLYRPWLLAVGCRKQDTVSSILLTTRIPLLVHLVSIKQISNNSVRLFKTTLMQLSEQFIRPI
jgi:hypothetical protein